MAERRRAGLVKAARSGEEASQGRMGDMRRLWRWLAGPDRLLDEIRRDLDARAVEVGGEKVVLWDEQRTRVMLGLPTQAGTAPGPSASAR